jgi:glucosamine-6-phosphate deaminase
MERDGMDFGTMSISATEMATNGKIGVKILGSEGELYYEMAMEMINEIVRKNANNEKTVFICPVGPVGQYGIFVRLVNEHKISLKNVYFINMDEYMADEKKPLDPDHPLSFRGFMQKEVYNRIAPELIMAEAQRIFPEPGRESQIWTTIQQLGGVDICLGGLGINGHIAFNEPPEEDEKMADEDFKDLPTRVLKITRETRTVNSITALGGAIEAMPKWCITVGMKEILSARKIRVYCFQNWHRSIVRQVVCGPVTNRVPASLIQRHPDAQIILTENAAGLPGLLWRRQ